MPLETGIARIVAVAALMALLGGGDGTKAGEHHNRDATDAAAYFQTLFGSDLGKIEAGFEAWLKTYESK